ncbi:EDD domain protein, DegV family [Gemella bergeri ATCC 700627]|uniref:EDD domain protein, DegV family n=1 Tax=Gemella bergeri ATCC 700627 TaxID=1321820 RepID=U2RRB8_9BACL|nr:DegV family protein [Gemella bergeri]ERK56078.1 EDD domain protein, DegV family [Gemella bergeri ATCC 700627]
MNWKIVVDTGCDLREIPNLAKNTVFERIPFSIQIGEKEYKDTLDLDIDFMMEKIYSSEKVARSACPSPNAFLSAYENADNIFVLTLTSGLSGSYNSAKIAEKMLYEINPTTNIHVIDSLSAGGHMDLLVLKLNSLIDQGYGFEEIVEKITEYHKNSKLLFVLEKVDNLVKNGRLSKLAATVVGLLNIRMVGEASAEGTLHLLHKVRGEKKAITEIISEMKKHGYKGGKVVITHRNNEGICKKLESKLREFYGNITFSIIRTSGLCSFYAEEGGILLGYEIN